ncbi:hypothetical protein RP726_07230 [Candidatus Methylospira mobilis]|uniref:hypothetical protein n=1 Tax=Candidatus Methylospira mobilis TaxID=1808979 RepID=UPI001D17C56F|nr:hypothetical protein [Candidatus Methylospira mobilis]WNV06197.1 hypothetical protein RP726_07230 [Candidatus Methylospira mobilis]
MNASSTKSNITGEYFRVLKKRLATTWPSFTLSQLSFGCGDTSTEPSNARQFVDLLRKFSAVDAVIELAADSHVYVDWEHACTSIFKEVPSSWLRHFTMQRRKKKQGAC